MTSTDSAEGHIFGTLPRFCRLDGLLALLLFVALGAVFLESPVRHLSDARYTMLLGEELLLYQSFDLTPYFVPYDFASVYQKEQTRRGLPRHVRRKGGHLFHVYPYGSSVLSVPFLAGMRVLGYSTLDAEGRYSRRGEMKVQAILAAWIAAATGLVFFFLARHLLSPGWSLAVALAGALGSQVWSVASRVMWTHTWGLALLSSALLLLVRGENRGGGRNLPWWHLSWLATLLSWAFFVRPTAIAYIVPIAFYVMWRDRWRSTAFFATGGLWLAAFLAHSRLVFGQPLPDYYVRGSDGLKLDTLLLGLEANLVSPGRGLLVYSPWVALGLYLMIRHWRKLRHRQLVVTCLAVATLHLLVVSSSYAWWAGSCYGPRFMTETVPLWVFLLAVTWRAALSGYASMGARTAVLRTRHTFLQAVAVLLFLVSGTFHGAGALSRSWNAWNSVPEDIAWQPMRVFDWNEPQFLWALDPKRVVEHRRAAERARWPRPRLAQALGENRPKVSRHEL